ncbi:hypothetical protein ACFY7A_30025 [Streptomyces longwoodensis]|uniref:hypothetical protein n=1 Tax=Streptomyces longwoodensis TaxID=68231 RepID=UPI0036B9B842
MPESIARAIESAPPTSARRLIAAGLIRRRPGSTLALRATPAGVTGTIRKAVTR